MKAFSIVLVLVGAVAFVLGLTSADPAHTWSIYLVNVLFWSGIAATGPAIAAIMQLTEARWSPSVRRIALTTAGFLPVAFALLIVLILGSDMLWAWVKPERFQGHARQLVDAKAAWLNLPFFWGRTLVLAVALFVTCFAFVRALLSDPMPPDSERERARRNRLAVILLFLWIITLSLWGYDLVMSLDPTWYSGLFGGYFVVTAMYTTFCMLSILTVSANARGLASIPPAAVQDVAKLQFALSIIWMYFFWSQYLVIWYGNVPIETRYLLRRFFVEPWRTLAWVVLIVGWLIPFIYLLKRLTGRPPQRHTPLVVMAVFGLVAIFLERVFLVFPSVMTDNSFLGIKDVLVTLGFFGLFILSRRWFIDRFKPVLNLPHTGMH
ncbi:MAG: hypothetical protein HYU41_17475 [Candidatus Rokubacteria bacterium]|nr:hypothetical protein [Candidatus Rokubacteria bacterium]